MTVSKIPFIGAGGKPATTWLATFFHQGKRHRKQGFDTKRAGEQWILAEQIRLNKQHESPRLKAEHITLGDFLDEWLDTIERGHGERPALERSTMRSYRTTSTHTKAIAGALKLDAINQASVIDLRKSLLKAHTRQVAQRCLTHLRIALNFAVQAGYLVHNPALSVKIANDHREDKRLKVVSRETVATIIDTLEARAGINPDLWLKFAVVMITLQATGLRISEVLGLTWASVDLDARELTVQQRLDYDRRLGKVKSQAALRTVMIDPHCVQWLKTWKQSCPESAQDLVFPNAAGRPESYHNLYHRKWVPLCRDLKLLTPEGKSPFAFHMLRHYRVSELIANKVHDHLIMDQVGHSSIKMTKDVYGHLFDDDRESQRAVLDGIGRARVSKPMPE